VQSENIRRLFFALWPSDALRAQIRQKTHALAQATRGRVIPPENFHVTILFLGEVLLSRVEVILTAGAQASTTADAFDLWLDQIECWPGSKVACLTAPVMPPALAALAGQLRFNLLEHQIKPHPQELRPHLTLARKVPRLRPPVAVPPARWSVEDFVLIDSRVSRFGSTYTVIGRWPLARHCVADNEDMT
jgi:RNA 2',3'-cyclic 3'-phosphodiesterase